MQRTRSHNLSAKQTEVVLNGLLDGVLIVDTAGRILFANAVCEQLFGRSRKKLIGENFGFPIETGHTQEIEVATKENTHTLELLASKIKWNNQDVFLMSLRDITEKKKLEITLDDAFKELQASFNKLTAANEELTRFNSIVSHDLKAPLRAIEGFSNVLAEEFNGSISDNAKAYLDKITKAAHRMAMLVDDLLSLSTLRVGDQQFVECDLNQLLKELVEELLPQISEQGGQIKYNDLPKVKCIPGLIKQVLQNLILNSIKFHKPGIPPIIEISAFYSPENSTQTIYVLDNGIGFDKRYAEAIFEIFRRLDTKAEYKGTGIGLSIVKKIIDLHHGTITAHSKPGEGAVFMITLPA